MKILFFISSLAGGGAERVLTTISNELVSRGHDVAIAMTYNRQVYKLDPKIKILCSNNVKVGKGIPERLFCCLYNKLIQSKETRKYIKDIAPDIIVSFMGAYLHPILKYKAEIPVILSEHSAYDNRRIGFSRRIDRLLYNKKCDKVVVLTDFDRGYSKAYGQRNTVVIPNPLSFPTISTSKYVETYKYRKNLMACGNIDRWEVKGFDYLIKIFSIISQEYKELNLDVYGDGDIEKVNLLKEMAKAEGVLDRIHFCGFTANIKEEMQKHSLMLLTSRSEGFPMAVVESLAVGTPCVAFDIPGAHAIIVDNIDGKLVERENVGKFAQSISKLINNPEMLFLMGKKGIENINRFSVNLIVEKWENIFVELKNS